LVLDTLYTITKNMSSDRFSSLNEHELQKNTEARFGQH